MLGTRPSLLRELVTSKIDYKQFIENMFNNDKLLVEECIKKDKKYITLLKEMTKDENKNGMNASVAMDITDMPTSDIAEGPVVKGFHVLAYDIQNKIFQFHSKSIYHATKQYLNDINK